MAHDQDTANQRIDHIQQQAQFHLLLPDNRRKRIGFNILFHHWRHRLPDRHEKAQKAQKIISETRCAFQKKPFVLFVPFSWLNFLDIDPKRE
jgi:hypothetical protein